MFWFVALYHNNLLADQALWPVEWLPETEVYLVGVLGHMKTSTKEKVWSRVRLSRTMKVLEEVEGR